MADFNKSRVDKQQGSVFNMALETLKQMNYCSLGCLNARHEENYMDWFKWLYDLYFSLEFVLSEKETKVIADKFKAAEMFVTAGMPNYTYNFIFTRLKDIEISLKRAMHKYDLLLPSKDDPRFASYE